MLTPTHAEHQHEHVAESPPQITTPPQTSHRSEERDLQINYGLLLLHHGKCESVRDTLTINHQTARNVSDQRDRNTGREAGRPAPPPPTTTTTATATANKQQDKPQPQPHTHTHTRKRKGRRTSIPSPSALKIASEA
ncbi:hypothetical protein V500_06623 [Pseudogymnoascus sp. VKM F-4518 (FW-2643)]|nr:hypothetical protein V500_06623 [Pseudogymnoascus sp. VKM F-4518 (FW-2643)]